MSYSSRNQYPRHTVGQHVVHFPFVFHKDATVQHAIDAIEQKKGSWPNSEFLYITDSNNKLIGLVDFRKLLAAKKAQTLEYVMEKKFFSITDHTHQEKAAQLAVVNDLETIPVTDSNGHFLGIIDSEQIFKILHENHVEKLMHFSGVLDVESISNGYKTNTIQAVTARIPSLVLGLVGGFVSISIIENFSHTLNSELALAFFIPVIVYMNAAVGTQIQTIFVRFSAFEKIKIQKALWHELKVTSVIGVILSVLIYAFSIMRFNNPAIAMIVLLSMFLGILTSVFIGIFIPWALLKLGKDPAIGSGPFTTILQDLLSIFIYFSIASALI